jgi:uncharacterized protein
MTKDTAKLPRLIGVIHLPPLPGSPRFAGSLEAIEHSVRQDLEVLVAAGFEAVVIENFGDVPFFPGRVPAVTVAAMTRFALLATATPLAVGINVLRNDAAAALSIAAATGADFVRINVHMGARLTDQGIVQGRAHETVRLKQQLGLDALRLFCDVAVKHSAALGERPFEEEAKELLERGAADAVLVTGNGTGQAVNTSELNRLCETLRGAVYVASGATIDNIAQLQAASGVIVGSCLRHGNRPGGPIDAERALAFANAFRALPSS